MTDHPEAAPGWDAIDAELRRHFPEPEVVHYGAPDGRLPGQDGIWGVSVYREGSGCFYITFGLTDVYPNNGDATEVSGWGFELTMRTPGSEPEGWAVRLINRLSRYVYSSGQPFAPGHRMDTRGPVTGGEPLTRLVALAFAPDPVLASIDTPNGAVEFLEVIGITADELARMKAMTTAHVLDELRQADPLLITDIRR